ncbi:MAG: hypothetical protein R2873_10395 [Caldilineaceae bacterium]
MSASWAMRLAIIATCRSVEDGVRRRHRRLAQLLCFAQGGFRIIRDRRKVDLHRTTDGVATTVWPDLVGVTGAAQRMLPGYSKVGSFMPPYFGITGFQLFQYCLIFFAQFTSDIHIDNCGTAYGRS